MFLRLRMLILSLQVENYSITLPAAPVIEDPPAPTPEPTPEPAPQAARPSGLQPPAPAVVWNDGTPILPHQARPARTVLADEYGYPIVSNSDVDPGEVVGSGDDIDEDGIGQM